MNIIPITPEPPKITGVEDVDLRSIHHVTGDGSETHQGCDFDVDKGGDCITLLGNPSPVAADGASNKTETKDGKKEAGTALAPPARISQKRLVELSRRLSERDINILVSLKKFRFLTTSQLQRLYFTDGSTRRKNLINTNRVLKKLREYGLATTLRRRIGGVRAGSSSLIWHLTEPGYRLLHIKDKERYPRKRFEEPSTLFLEHTLAIAETAVQLTCICNISEDLSVEQLDPEPTCWRPYMVDGRTVYLKPDLYAVTVYDGYEDSWFLEIDLSTEPPAKVVEKCETYIRYYNTGIEQDLNEVFPMVVWIVKDKARKERLKQYIRDNIPNRPKMFLVITPDQLEKMVRQFIDRGEIC